MERSIRGLKTQYRRISGRKNWNAYLLRYGRCVAYASLVGARCGPSPATVEQRAARLDRTRWRELRRETTAAHSEQLTRFRFRHKRQAYLALLRGTLGCCCSHAFFALTEKKADQEKATILWVDEAGFYLLPMAVRTWAPRGQTPLLRVKLTRDHLSAISGITLDGRLFMQVRPDFL